MGHSSHGLWGLVWSEFINLNYIFGIESLIYHFWRNCNNLGWKKKKTGLVWHCFLCCNIFIYRPRIYLVLVLVLVLGALEALQCIICHFLRMESRTNRSSDIRSVKQLVNWFNLQDGLLHIHNKFHLFGYVYSTNQFRISWLSSARLT